MENTEYLYSLDDEFYHEEDYIADALISNHKVGDIVKLSRGERGYAPKASSFAPDIIERLEERACDEFGEHAGEWPDTKKEWKEELQNLLENLIDEWADKHNLQPSFCSIEKTKEINVKIINESGEFEQVEPLTSSTVSGS